MVLLMVGVLVPPLTLVLVPVLVLLMVGVCVALRVAVEVLQAEAEPLRLCVPLPL